MSVRIEVEELSAGYKYPVVSGLSFRLRAGEIMTVIGPNGCGKSTVLKTLSGGLKALGGRILFDGVDASSLGHKERAKRLAAVLTERPRPELMTCRDVVETGRYPYTGYFGALTDEDKRVAERAIKLVKIEDIADRDFNLLSDGQRQRVMLARAICQRPGILILDEPTSFLDVHHKIAFLETLRRLVSEEGLAAVISMHELDFAEEISDCALAIKGGGVFSYGSPEKVFAKETVRGLFDLPDEVYLRYFK